MADDVLWTLVADGEPTIAAFEQMDEAATIMGDTMSQVFASISEASAYADEQIALLAASNGDLEVAFTSMGTAVSYADEQLILYSDEVLAAAASTTTLATAQAENTAATEANAAAQEADAASIEATGAAAGTSAKLVDVFKTALLGISVAGIAVGVISTKMAGDFQSNITKLYTTANESKANLQMVGDGMLSMSSQVGTGALQLSQSMYWIESGGLHGAKALEAERVAAEAAKAENANLDKVSIALAASLNAYASSGMSDVEVMNTLTASTGQGMMTFEQLSGSLASVLPAAAKFHISLNNVTAAMADMTAQGDPADQAATHLKQLLLALEAPSKIGAAALKSVGLTSTEVSDEMKKSLPDALRMITDAVGRKFPEGSAAYNQAIKNIAGGSKQMMGFLELTGSHMKTFADNVKTISDKVKEGGNNLMGWSDIQQNFNFKLDQAKAAVEALFIGLGTHLLPIFGQIVTTITPIIQGFSDWINWMSQGNDALTWFNNNAQIIIPVLAGLGAVIAYVLVPAVWSFAAGVIAATWPLLAIGAAVAAVVAILVYAYQHWTAFRNIVNSIIPALETLWSWVQRYIIPAFASMWSWIQNNIVPALASLWDWIQNNVVIALTAMWDWITNSLVPALASAWDWVQNNIVPALSDMWDWLANNVTPALASVWDWIQNSLVPALSRMWDWVQNNVVSALQHLWDIVGQVVTKLQSWYDKVMGVIDSIRQWNDKNDALHKGVGAVQGILQKVNDYINTQLIPTFNNIKTIITTQLIPAFQGAYNAIAPLVSNYLGTLKQAFGQIGQAIQTLGPYFDTLKKDFQEIGKLLQPFAQYWWIVLIPLAAVVTEMGLFLLAIGAVGVMLAKFVQGVATFVTGVVQVFSGFIQIASGYLQALDDLIHGHFDKLDQDTKVAGDGFKMLWQGVWNVIQGIWMASLGGIIAGAQWFVTTIFNLFVDLYNKLVGHSIVPDIVNGIASWFGKLPGMALTWGSDMINGFINGIKGQMGNLGNTITGVASTIRNFLHFSKPDVGPLADADTYGKDFMELYATSLESGIPHLRQTLNTIAGSMAANISPNVMMPGASGTSSLSGGGSTAVFYQILQVLQQIQQQQRGGGSNTISNVQNNQFNGGGGGQGMQELYALLNQMAGQQFESGLRGSF